MYAFNRLKKYYLIFRRVVSASVDWFEARCKEYRHRPSPAARRGLDKTHINFVHVWTLLSVHLDIDEAFVHDGRHLQYPNKQDLVNGDIALFFIYRFNQNKPSRA